MKVKELIGSNPVVFVLIFETGDEFTAGVKQFAKDHGIHGASLTAIGALERCTLGWFDWEAKEYVKIPIDEQCEVASLIGDIAINDGEPMLHAHIVVGTKGGTAHAGHIMEAWVRPTLEVVVTKLPAYLNRAYDEASHIPLIDLEKTWID